MSKRRIFPGWLVVAVAMTFLSGSLVTGEETTEDKSDEPALELNRGASPEEMEAQIEAYMKARRRAVEDMLAADPQWQPALRPSHVIQVGPDGKRGEVNNFCLDTSGNVLACCTSARQDFDNRDEKNPDADLASPAGEIRVFSPDGQQLQTWPLSFTPQAITAHPDGTVFVAGDGHIAQLDRRGKVLATAALTSSLPKKPARSKPSDEQAEVEEPDADGQTEVEQEEGQRQESPASDPDQPDDQAAADAEPAGKTGDGSSTTGSVFGALFRLVTGSGADDQQDQAMREYMARREREITGIAVTDQHLFVARSSKTGYAIWRMGHDFAEPVKIVDRLRGCCGQMDITAFDGHVYAAENARKRVVWYDRDGEQVGKFGSGDRKKASGFGSCCNPMNVCFSPAGDVIASESGPPDAVKRFSADGEFLGVLALPQFQGGCVRVQVQMSPDGKRLFVLNNRAAEIHVFADPRYVPTHEQIATIDIPMGDQKAAIHSFCLAADGNLLAACGGQRMVYVRKAGGLRVDVVNEPSGIRVVSPDGDLLDTWSLEITPQVVNVGPDGSVYCGGQGRLAKLTAQGKVQLVADSPQVAELPPLPPAESEPEEEAEEEEEEATRKAKEEEKQAKIEQLNSARQTAMKELMELHKQVRAKKDDDQAKAQLEAELEQAMLQYRRIHEQLQQLTVDPHVLAARLRSAALRQRTISGIAVTGKDVFIACPASEGYGYDVWRTDRDFQDPQKIVTKLRGCCGQMDIQARDGKLYAAENSRKRMVCYDRDGTELAAWGKGDRKRIEDFGSCCNPMNARFGPSGQLYTSEASLGRIKRYSADGEFLGLVGTATIVPGCKHVPIAISPDGDRVYLLDITRTHIVVLQRRETADGREPAGTEVSQVP